MLLYMVHIEVWCNGNTQDFGSCIRGSNPFTSTSSLSCQLKATLTFHNFVINKNDKEHYCCDNRDALILMNANLNNYSMETTFTKSDLKSGMIVQLNNGNYYLVIESNDGQILCGNTTFPLTRYNDNLNYCNANYCDSEAKKFDIDKVFLASRGAHVEYYLKGYYLKEIWSRFNIINITEKDLKRFKINDNDIVKLTLNNGDVITIE